jgi:hypothetical protein
MTVSTGAVRTAGAGDGAHEQGGAQAAGHGGVGTGDRILSEAGNDGTGEASEPDAAGVIRRASAWDCTSSCALGS